MDGLARGFIFDPPFRRIVDQDLEDGTSTRPIDPSGLPLPSSTIHPSSPRKLKKWDFTCVKSSALTDWPDGFRTSLTGGRIGLHARRSCTPLGRSGGRRASLG